MVSNEGKHTLLIPKLLLEHTGTYVCRAINPYGVVESSAKLKVFIHKSTSQPDSLMNPKKGRKPSDKSDTELKNETNGSLNI